MESLDIARDLYSATAKEVDGGRLTVLTGELKEVANALENPGSIPRALRGNVRGEVRELFERHDEEASASLLDDTAVHLRKGAEHLEQAMGKVNPHMHDLPDGVAGQAHLGEQGTETVDPLATLNVQGQASLIDVEMARAVAEHERFHVGQREPDAEVNGMNVTAYEFIEAGAIAAQLKVAPQSLSKLSQGYQILYRKVLGLLPDSQRVMELSKEGKLRQFAKEAGSVEHALAA